MIEPGDGGNGSTDTQDEELLADLFDTMLQEILEGRTPELQAYLPERPELQARVAKTWSLACSVAGRREPSRPVLGGYEILRELGHGGMGTVYLARHQVLQREVAIKVLPQSLAMSPRAKQRFLDEARALARVQHENIVHIHRVLDHSEMLAFEMELIDGPSLQQVVQALRTRARPHALDSLAEVLQLPVNAIGARTTVEWTVRLGIRIARALAEVHRFGLVHRDVKPSNILLRSDGRPVLADFGLAREDDPAAPGALDRSNSFAGTAVYAAPERLRAGDADLDGRADIYSLGVTLCECLTQKTPYPGNTTEQVLRQIDAGRFTGLRRDAPHVSRDLEMVIGKAMEPDPRHRYADADEFADDLERVLNFEPVRAKPASVPRRIGKFLRRHRRIALAATAGAMVVFGGLWPVLEHLATASSELARANRELQLARTAVMSPENLHATWARTVAGGSRAWLRQEASAQAQTTALQQAIGHYDRALASGVVSPTATLERDVVALTILALQPRSTRLDDGELDAMLAPLPPLTAQVARRLLLDAPGPDENHDEVVLSTTTPRDRLAAGYLAFLLGDLATTAPCWLGLDQQLSDHPLLDACGALLVANDGYPERAYPRLFHAAKAFPGSTALALALADAALVMGDLQLAQSWLDSVPDRDDQPFARARRELLAADLLAATGDPGAAAAAYRRLAHQNANDPLPVQRLAELAMQQGDWGSAERQFRNLLRRWPALPAARLELARIALLRRDVPGYFEQARHALAQRPGDHSPGAASRFAEILRVGGLEELLREHFGSSQQRSGIGWRTAPVPLGGWLSPSTVNGITQVLRVMAVYDERASAYREIDSRTLPSLLNAAWLTALRLPQLTWKLPPLARVAVVAGPPLLGEAAAVRIATMLTPWARSLGDPMHVIPVPLLWRTQLQSTKSMFAAHLLRAGDLDGDTLDEICAASIDPPGSTAPFGIELRTLQDGTLLRRIVNEDDSLMFGRGLTVIDDVDGDYCNDLVIGAPNTGDLSAASEVQVRSGRTGARIWTATSDIDAFGVAVITVPDLDSDGYPDVLAGASAPSLQRSERGRAIVLSGRTGAVLRELVVSQGGSWYGGALAPLGDVDGDGRADVAIGGNYGNAPGLVEVIDPRDGRVLLTFGDEDRNTDFGEEIVGLGDLDRDGHCDLAITAPGRSSRGKLPGAVLVMSGATGKLLFELLGESAGEGFGSRVCFLPDWRLDSRPALAVSARRGGPFGSGYVRVFDAATGRPLQTVAGSPGSALFGYSLADLGDCDGDGLRDLGLAELSRNRVANIKTMSFAMVPLADSVGSRSR